MCQYCHQSICPPRCPNFVSPRANLYCSVCGEGIYEGEEYIENEEGDYRHFDCFYGMKDLLEWLGYKIKTMEDSVNYD